MTTTQLQPVRWREAVDEDAASVAESKSNPAAFSVLYDRYVEKIYRYHYYRTGSVPEAEDLTSQTFLAALEALPRYQHQGNFAAWLFRIARGKAIDTFRRQQKQTPLDDSYVAESGDMLAQVACSDEIAHLSALIRTLDEDQQELIRLRYTAGLPFAQIAVVLDSNENTIKKSLYRVLARLQSQMENLHHG
jgi:RNA polymerase sigma-70 factor, ECF subfamily